MGSTLIEPSSKDDEESIIRRACSHSGSSFVLTLNIIFMHKEFGWDLQRQKKYGPDLPPFDCSITREKEPNEECHALPVPPTCLLCCSTATFLSPSFQENQHPLFPPAPRCTLPIVGLSPRFSPDADKFCYLPPCPASQAQDLSGPGSESFWRQFHSKFEGEVSQGLRTGHGRHGDRGSCR